MLGGEVVRTPCPVTPPLCDPRWDTPIVVTPSVTPHQRTRGLKAMILSTISTVKSPVNTMLSRSIT